jgi:hypothetical protein
MWDPPIALAELKLAGVDEELAPAFLEHADDRMRSLRQEMGRRDAAAIAQSADFLRGASAHLGATHLALLCGTLGADAAGGNLADLYALVDAIEFEITGIRSSIKPSSSFGVLPRVAVLPSRTMERGSGGDR